MIAKALQPNAESRYRSGRELLERPIGLLDVGGYFDSHETWGIQSVFIILGKQEAGFDGFSELWFESEEDLVASLKSPEGVTLLADLPNFTASIEPVISVETQMLWP